MGQYYSPICVDTKEYLHTHDYDNGLKLMEHSYLGNDFMDAVCRLLLPGEPWHGRSIVWAGDYADPEPAIKVPDGWNQEKQGEPNLYSIVREYGEKLHPPSQPIPAKYHYLVNHSKRVAVDLAALKPDGEGYTIHPLSLLTAEGNGRGGGDFHQEDSRVGSWARDRISLEESLPSGYGLCDGQFFEARRHR